MSSTPHDPDTPHDPPNRHPEGGRGKGTTGRSGARDIAAALLAAGGKFVDVAMRAGIAERTLRKWFAEDPTFRRRVDEFRGEFVRECLGRLSDGMGESADVLRALLKDADPDVRHRAAVKVIELGVKLRDQEDLAERLRRVEEQLVGGGSDGTPDAGRGGANRADGTGTQQPP